MPSRLRSSVGQHKQGNASLRIVGGRFRGRKLRYLGDPRVRPMKDRVREALFNLIGPAIREKYAIDLFGGTGALALEAISRGAVGATIIERHYPTARVARENAASVEVADQVQVITADTFWWLQQLPDLPKDPWVVFCSPPYAFYQQRADDMLLLIRQMLERAAEASIVAVESAQDFDFSTLPNPDRWDVRPYPPAVLGVYVVGSA